MGNCCSRNEKRSYLPAELIDITTTAAATAVTGGCNSNCSSRLKPFYRLRLASTSMANRLAPAVISATGKHTATVIFLHGLGDTGHGWCEEFRQRALPWIKYIFPHAPSQPVSLNAGMSMPSWFDIKGLSPNSAQDEEGVLAASGNLAKMIEEEVKILTSSKRIVIGGFSQGGAVALHTFFTTKITLGGVLAFSTWLPLHDKIMASATGVNKNVPVLQCHGDMDPMVPITWGKLTAQFLQQLNPKHDIITLHGVLHSSSPQEMEESKVFLQKILPDSE